MAAHGCDLDTAFKFLSDQTGWAGEPIVLERCLSPILQRAA